MEVNIRKLTDDTSNLWRCSSNFSASVGNDSCFTQLYQKACSLLKNRIGMSQIYLSHKLQLLTIFFAVLVSLYRWLQFSSCLLRWCVLCCQVNCCFSASSDQFYRKPLSSLGRTFKAWFACTVETSSIYLYGDNFWWKPRWMWC